MKRFLISVVLVCALAGGSVSRADVMQEFGYQLKDVKAYGGFTVVFRLRVYDTTGVAPPPLKAAFLRLPAGANIRRDFLSKRFFCNVRKLNDTKDPRVCKKAEIGRGTVLVDARPLVTEAIPAKIFLFLARGTEPGAVASIAILGVPDTSSPVVKGNPFIEGYKVVLSANFFREPSADRRFGYKLVLPTGPIKGVQISVAEVDVTLPGLTVTKRHRSCVRKRAGRCVERRTATKKLYWFTIPHCPSSATYPFQAVFTYAGLPTMTRDIEIPCSQFTR